MNTKINTAHVATTTGTAVDDSAASKTGEAHSPIIPHLPPQCNDVLRHIPQGRENAVHLCDLVRYTGLHERVTRRCIEIARGAGIPVLADERGY